MAEEAHVQHPRREPPAGDLVGPPRRPIAAGPDRAVDEKEAGDPVVEQEGQERPVPPAPAGLGEGEKDSEPEGQERAREPGHEVPIQSANGLPTSSVTAAGWTTRAGTRPAGPSGP